MKKIIALILVIAGIWAIHEELWAEDTVTYHRTGTYSRYNDYYDYLDYEDDWEDDADDYYTMKCSWCRGSGDCKDCDGDGKSRLKGVMASYGCVLCESTGDCYKCDGNGYTVHR